MGDLSPGDARAPALAIDPGPAARGRAHRVIDRRAAPARVRDRLPLVLVLACLVVYVPGIHWGLPSFTGRDQSHSWGNDDLVPLAPLAEMYNTFVQEEPNRNVAYPWFHYFLVAAAYGPYLAYLLATGRLREPAATYPFGIDDPETVLRNLTWIGRSVSLALAVALILGVYYAGRSLWGRRAGLASATFALLMYPLAYYAKLGNPDVPALAWTSLGLAAAAPCVRQGMDARRAAAVGAFAALAIATKDQAAGSFFLLLPALLWLHWRTGVAARRDRAWARRPALALTGGFAVTYLLAGGAIVDPGRFVQHVGKVLSVGAGTVELYNRHPASLSGYAAQVTDLARYLLEVLSPPVLLLALAGIVLAARRDRSSLLLLLASVGFFLILVPVRFGRIHYLLPVALPLTLFAGYAVARGLEGTRAARAVAAGAALLGSGLLFLQTVDLAHAMIRDSRFEAAAWLDDHTRAGDRVLYFGATMRMPPLRGDIAMLQVDFRAHARPTLVGREADFVIIMPDDTNEERRRVDWRQGRYSIHSDYLSSEDFDALVNGSLGYRLVARFQSPRLLPWLPRPFLSYPTVNPPIHVFAREDRAGDMPRLEPWWTAPHYPEPWGSYEPLLVRPGGAGPAGRRGVAR